MNADRIRWIASALFAVHVACFLIAELVQAGRIGAPIDDGWIYLAFARSLADGEGITYPGHDGPLCAVTGPIWNAILAAGVWVFGSSIGVAKAIGITTGYIAIRAADRLGRVASGDARVGALLALLLAATPRFVWGSISVMEVPFFVATVAGGLALHLERRHDGFTRWLPALLVTWLAGWARPECFVFTLFVALDRRRLADVGAALGLLALYPAYHFAAYGHPLPTTFYAKAAGDAPWSILARDGVGPAFAQSIWRPIEQVGRFVSYLPTYLPIVVLGFVPGLLRARREARAGIVTIAWMLLGFIAARGVLGVVSPPFQYGRYFGHVWVLFAAVSIYGFDLGRVAKWSGWLVLGLVVALLSVFFDATAGFAFDWISGSRVTAGGAEAVLWGSLAIGVVLLVAGAVRRPARPTVWMVAPYLLAAIAFGATRSGYNVRDTYALNVAMAEKVREIVPPGELVACHDIGALGYFAERPLLDLAGLGSPEVVFGPRRADGRIDAQAVLAEHRPRWLCLTLAMSAQVFDRERGVPEGFVGAEQAASIRYPDNVTLLGDTYLLMELRWLP